MKEKGEIEKRLAFEKWQNKKTEWDSLESYSDKLAWWEINVPPRNLKFNIMPEFQYSFEGAPIIENTPCAIITYHFDKIIIDTSAVTNVPEFISILPMTFDSKEKQLFWDWLSVKINLAPIEHYEQDYREQLENILPLNRKEVIDKFKNELDLERDKHKNHVDYQYGREYAIYNNPKYLNFGNPNIYFMGIEGSINRIIKGYQNNLKEIALDKVINSLNNKTEIIEPIEDIPNPNKIKWLGTPSQFSYLFLELVRKGFIEQPLYRGDTSPSRYAELCFNNFDIETTMNSLKTEFKNNSSLSETYRSKFTIPEKSESTDKRSGNNKK